MPQAVHDCAMKLIAEGKDEASAWAICNSQILGGASNLVNYTIDPSGDLHLKYFFADTSFARRSPIEGFSLNGGAIDSYDNEAVGLPFSILPSRDLSIRNDWHPWSPKPGATWEDHVTFARDYSPGVIEALTRISNSDNPLAKDVMNNNGRFALVHITDKGANEAWKANPDLIPKAVSPGLLNLEYPNQIDIKKFRWAHLAAVPTGAYGDKATLYASCIGPDAKCLNHLLAASKIDLENSAKTYCPIGASENLNKFSSLGDLDVNSSTMSINDNTTATTPAAALTTTATASPTSTAPPSQTGALSTAQVPPTQNAPLRLKLVGNQNQTQQQVTAPLDQQPKPDPRIDKVEQRLAEIDKANAMASRLKEVANLIPIQLFTVKGKYNQQEHEKTIKEAAESGWTDEQITRYYGGLLRIKEFDETNKDGNPLGGSYSSSGSSSNYQTPSQVPEGGGTMEDPVITATKGLFRICHLERRLE